MPAIAPHSAPALRTTGLVLPLLAAGLIPFLMSSTALAACVGGPAVIDCFGDLTGGTQQTATAPSTTLNIFGLTNTITGMAANNDGVSLIGAGAFGTIGGNGTDGDPPTPGDPGGVGGLGPNAVINYQDTNFGIIGTNNNVDGIVAFSGGGQGGGGGVGGTSIGAVFGAAGGAGGAGGSGAVVVVSSVAPSINVSLGSGISAQSLGGFGGAGGGAALALLPVSRAARAAMVAPAAMAVRSPSAIPAPARSPLPNTQSSVSAAVVMAGREGCDSVLWGIC